MRITNGYIVKFSNTLMKPGGVQGQNGHNSENQECSEKDCVNSIVSVYTKRLINSRHRVHWLASKPDSLSLGKIQGQKLSLPMQLFSTDTLSNLSSCSFDSSPKFHSCGGLLENIVFLHKLFYDQINILVKVGPSTCAFLVAWRVTRYIYLFKTDKWWIRNLVSKCPIYVWSLLGKFY